MKIAVIGAGPSGLFFCHAIEQIVKKTGKEVRVVCFERSSQPGGVWRTADEHDPAYTDATNMYDKLWTNGASHCTEFHDYTYDEHFGAPVSVYMRRQDLLEYITSRVQKNCDGDFFEKYIKFRHSVEHVAFDDAKQQFDVTVHDLATGESAVTAFDKCIWACGENGKRNMPEQLVKVFKDFRGTVLHSSDVSQFEENVRGKRILLVGGGYSSEDLALQAIKLGVEKVFVSSRGTSDEIHYINEWPKDKVVVLNEQVPFNVTENGKCIEFHEVTWTFDGFKRYGDYVETELRNIDTVVLCTGYKVNLDMLDESLNKGFPASGIPIEEKLTIPKDWKMPENVLSKYTGEVDVADSVRYCPCYVHPRFYRGVLISNPNMMFLSTYGSHVPLMACDAYAHLLAGFATGTVEMPTPDEMRRRNEAEALRLFGKPYFRYLADEKYYETVTNLPDFWPNDSKAGQPQWDEAAYEEYIESIRRVAGILQEAKYPFSLGTSEELNENGKAIARFGDLDSEARSKLKLSPAEKMWKTFRDITETSALYSLFTGTKAVPLKQRWMNIDAPRRSSPTSVEATAEPFDFPTASASLSQH